VSRESTLSSLAEVRGYALRIMNAVDDTIEIFIDPSDDLDKQERVFLLYSAVEAAGQLSRVVEQIQDDGLISSMWIIGEEGDAEEEDEIDVA